ncbi:40S ribosomal protein S4, partial [Galemys pyrenaicus]
VQGLKNPLGSHGLWSQEASAASPSSKALGAGPNDRVFALSLVPMKWENVSLLRRLKISRTGHEVKIWMANLHGTKEHFCLICGPRVALLFITLHLRRPHAGCMTDFIKFDSGNRCVVTGGADLARRGVITSRERHPGETRPWRQLCHLPHQHVCYWQKLQNTDFSSLRKKSLLTNAEERDKRLATKQRSGRNAF